MNLAIFDLDGTLTKTNEVDTLCYVRAVDEGAPAALEQRAQPTLPVDRLARAGADGHVEARLAQDVGVRPAVSGVRGLDEHPGSPAPLRPFAGLERRPSARSPEREVIHGASSRLPRTIVHAVPPGIRAAFIGLAQRLGSEHEAHHQMMECLGEMIWNSQRSGLPPDGVAYIECVKRR